jgi:hypothetical protein
MSGREGEMSEDIFICDCCGYPIIFRYGQAHHPFHLGTGWDCWDMRKRGECTRVLNFPFTGNTPDKLKKELDKEAKSICRRYFRSSDVEPAIGFIRKHVFQRGDVVRSLFGFLADEDTHDAQELVRRLVNSEPWQFFFLKLKAKAKAEGGD